MSLDRQTCCQRTIHFACGYRKFAAGISAGGIDSIGFFKDVFEAAPSSSVIDDNVPDIPGVHLYTRGVWFVIAIPFVRGLDELSILHRDRTIWPHHYISILASGS